MTDIDERIRAALEGSDACVLGNSYLNNIKQLIRDVIEEVKLPVKCGEQAEAKNSTAEISAFTATCRIGNKYIDDAMKELGL